jgi:ABC-type cobalamin/Fe3+-siderophores transport system ATPase subunit
LEEKAVFELRNINVTFTKGSFVVIVGGNGSGKTSLLYAILGELQKISGRVLFMEGNLSMAS